MPYYPEYAWIQESIDATIAENEKVKALIEKLKNKSKNQRDYLIVPFYLVKNPVEYIYVELESRDGLSVLECKLSEN